MALNLVNCVFPDPKLSQNIVAARELLKRDGCASLNDEEAGTSDM